MARDESSRNDLPDGFVEQTIARLLEQGRTDRLYMRTDAARARFSEALEVCPDHPDAIMELGTTGDPIRVLSEEEAATLKRAAQALPDSIEVALALATARRDDPKEQASAVDDCMALCDTRLAQVPDDIVALAAKAQMFLWKRDFKAMEVVSRRAVELAPRDQKCLNYLALSLARQNQWDQAYPVYETMYGLDKNTIWAYVALRQMGSYLAFHLGDWGTGRGHAGKVWDLTGRPNEPATSSTSTAAPGWRGKPKRCSTRSETTVIPRGCTISWGTQVELSDVTGQPGHPQSISVVSGRYRC